MLWFLVSFRISFSDNTSVRIFFFQNLTLGYMTNTLNQIIFFSSTKIRIFFSATLGIRIFFYEKSHTPSPFKLNGRSLRQNVLVHVFIIRTIRFDYFAKSYKQRLQHDSFVDMLECSCCFSWLYF